MIQEPPGQAIDSIGDMTSLFQSCYCHRGKPYSFHALPHLSEVMQYFWIRRSPALRLFKTQDVAFQNEKNAVVSG